MTATIHKLPLANWPASDDLGNVPITVMVSEETVAYWRKVAAEATSRNGVRITERFACAAALTDIAKKAAE